MWFALRIMTIIFSQRDRLSYLRRVIGGKAHVMRFLVMVHLLQLWLLSSFAAAWTTPKVKKFKSSAFHLYHFIRLKKFKENPLMMICWCAIWVVELLHNNRSKTKLTCESHWIIDIWSKSKVWSLSFIPCCIFSFCLCKLLYGSIY